MSFSANYYQRWIRVYLNKTKENFVLGQGIQGQLVRFYVYSQAGKI